MRFEDLIEQYHDEIYRYLWRMLAASGTARHLEAADLTQETFERAYRAYGRLRPNNNVRAWLYRIATNRARTAFKRARHQTPLTDGIIHTHADSTPGPAAQTQQADDHRRLRGWLAELPGKQRAAVILRYLESLSYAEVADALGCSVESARANVSHGLRALRRALAEEEREASA